MDQINQVPATETPSQTPVQPAQTPVQSPPPPVSPPGFTPKKSNVKLLAGVLGGILIIVIGAAMILGKTKTYKGSLTKEDIEAGRLAEQEPSKITETPPNEGLIALCNSIGGLWNPGYAECSFNGQNYGDESSLNAAYGEVQKGILEDNKLQEIGSLVKTINGLATQAEQVFGALPKASDTDALIVMANKITGFLNEAKTALASIQSLISSLTIEENKQKVQPLLAEANQALTSIENYNNQAIPMAKEAAINKQIKEEQKQQTQAQLKSECESTPGARWNEDGDNSGCIFGKTEHLSAASPESQAIADKAKQKQEYPTGPTGVIAMVTPSEPESGQKPLGAASDKSLAIATIAKIDAASRDAAEAAKFVADLLKQYPNNADIQSANAKAQNAAATAMDALGFAKDETDLDILDTLLGKADLAASNALDAKYAALDAADAEDAKKQIVMSESETEDEFSAEEEIAELKVEIEDLKGQLNDAKNDNDKTLINQLIAEIAALNAKISSLGGQPVNVTVNVPEYKSAAPELECPDPNFVYDPFKKKCIAPTEVGASSSGSGGGGGTKSASSAEGKKGAMEIPEMWGDEVKTKTIETPEMWGDAAPAPKKSTGAAKAGSSYGATIQGKTGPGVLLYPVFIGAVNGLYYLARKRRRIN